MNRNARIRELVQVLLRLITKELALEKVSLDSWVVEEYTSTRSQDPILSRHIKMLFVSKRFRSGIFLILHRSGLFSSLYIIGKISILLYMSGLSFLWIVSMGISLVPGLHVTDVYSSIDSVYKILVESLRLAPFLRDLKTHWNLSCS